MKKHFYVPAQLSAFSGEGEGDTRFTRAKLKVFYKGTTADNRLFTEEFSSGLIKTLPLTPVVGYYDAEKEDFVGHATEQQILGVVDPTVEPQFEKADDGNTWAVCDTVLYTERPDQVGDIAKKIVGKSQSLELNPKTIQYKVNYDEKKHFKNLEFTAGEIIGLSVLGDDQKPAFTGSSFFSCFGENDFVKKMNMLKEYCAEEAVKRTANMDKNTNFIELAYGEQMLKVEEAFASAYANDGCSYLVDAYPSYAIMRIYYYADGSQKLLKVNYTIDGEGKVTLGEVKEVRVTYEEVPDTSASSEGFAAETKPEEEKEDLKKKEECSTADEDLKKKEECSTSEEDLKKKEECSTSEEDLKKKEECSNSEEDLKKKEECSTSEEDLKKKEECAQTEPKEDPVPEEEKEKEDEKAKANAEANSVEGDPNVNHTSETETNTPDPTALSKSEREELETLRKASKINLINSYANRLPQEIVDGLIAKVDSYDNEKDLKFDILEALESNRVEQTVTKIMPFSTVGNSGKEADEYAQYIRNNL